MKAGAPRFAKRCLDLNADLGGGYGEELALLEIITTAEITFDPPGCK